MRHDIQHYDEKLKELKYPQRHKVIKILENNCIREISKNEWNCLPIKGYNTRTYKIVVRPDGEYECNCQGCQTLIRANEEPNCSHIMAVKMSESDNVQIKLDL